MELVFNEQQTEKHAIHYMVVNQKHVIDNLKIILGESTLDNVLAFTTKGQSFHDIKRFCHLAVLIEFDAGINKLSLKMTDFLSNIDNVLDEFSMLTVNDWEKTDKDKYVRIVSDTIENPSKKCVLVKENAF
jgi:SpoVK/Ycf46/Vps4 family AAA+-type ATPase